MTAHKGGQTCRATEGRREGGFFPRAHLMWQRVCDLPGVSLPPQSLEKSIAEESGGVAGGGRQGTADDREKQFSVRGDHGRLIARGS